jgi:hypothetical protein
MPEVTSDEIGRRKFQIQKTKSVELAIEKMRRSLGSQWVLFSPPEIEALAYILGETWVSLDRTTWENCSFVRLTKNDVEKIIRLAEDVKRKEKLESAAVEEISALLRAYT